ncbi:hypothetical protein [Ancylomarina sp. 16SWW S1-10-2]|uniref:hypothetical protein n=1 Tax=Ancylomarina sp. 16SWW S1-10-2 TaxID=2499681 RepID=UPI0012AE3D83|nr:hypothetical protein [Ancylomarina sp. 16SWW S1-10-2]MRT93648.1 hypothetical protein [Ancylomarina sp. 16SWW S1-10-2]
MKFFIFIASALLLTSCNLETKETSKITESEKEIAKDLIQGAFDDLWSGMDSTKILTYHTNDFVILENGEVWDNNRIKKFMRVKSADKNRAKRINMMDYISIEKYGSSMQIAYHNKAEFYKQDSLVFTCGWLESALAVKTPVGWRLKMMHSTRKK